MRRRRVVAALIVSAMLGFAVGAILAADRWGEGDAPPRPSVPQPGPASGEPSRGQTQARSGGAKPGGAALARPGANPGALPGNVLIADRGNNRLLEVDPKGRVVWRFPRPGDLAPGQTFQVPDDAFFSPDGRSIVATQEDNDVISVIDVAASRIVYRYGVPGVPGSSPGHLAHPDDALLTARGEILTADIENCRLLVLRPPSHAPLRQFGSPLDCTHDPPRSFGDPNGAFPTSGGGTVVTEIIGNWADLLAPSGKLLGATHPPGFSYPSDTNELRPGVFLSVDYADPGAIEAFDIHGRLRWRFAPTGPNALNHPSLALPLPNGDVLANDDLNHRVIVVDPRTKRIVWQYGHTGQPGQRQGYLNNPDGVDLAPPNSLLSRFPDARPPG